MSLQDIERRRDITRHKPTVHRAKEFTIPPWDHVSNSHHRSAERNPPPTRTMTQLEAMSYSTDGGGEGAMMGGRGGGGDATSASHYEQGVPGEPSTGNDGLVCHQHIQPHIEVSLDGIEVEIELPPSAGSRATEFRDSTLHGFGLRHI